MADNFVCHVCKDAKAELFAMSPHNEKVPLCTVHFGKFIATHPTFTIDRPPAGNSAFHTIPPETLRKERVVVAALQEDGAEYQKSCQRLQELKSAAIEKVENGFTMAGDKLRTMHERVKAILEAAGREVELAKTSENPAFTQLTWNIVNSNAPRKVPKYSVCVADVSSKLSAPLQEVVTFPFADAEAFFQGMQTEAVVRLSAVQIPQNVTVPIAVAAPQSVPRQSFAPPPRQWRKEYNCDSCGINVSRSPHHDCTGGHVRCLECHQYLVATTCFGMRAECPECGAIPGEIYDNLAKLECDECGIRLRINQVAHWCEDDDYLVCEACKPNCDC